MYDWGMVEVCGIYEEEEGAECFYTSYVGGNRVFDSYA